MEDFKTFLAWRDRHRFEGLWERVGKMYEAQPVKIMTQQEPWGISARALAAGKDRTFCKAPIKKPRRYLYPCNFVAGVNTAHMGAGRCWLHGGNKPDGNTEAFMMIAMGIADRFHITPAEALQEELERTAYAVRWLDAEVNKANTPAELMSEFGDLMKLRMWERDHLVKVALTSINAGVSQLLADQMRSDGEQIARVLNKALAALDLSPQQEDAARSVLARDLMSLGATSTPAALVDSGHKKALS